MKIFCQIPDYRKKITIMKTFLPKLLVCCVILISFDQADAKTYGGFKPKKTFTFPVTQRSSISVSALKTDASAPIPPEFPNFVEGQNVKFTISPRGQLTGPMFSLPLVGSNNAGNVYILERKSNKAYLNWNAQIAKGEQQTPRLVVLSFTKITGSGIKLKTQTVSYILE